MSYPSTESFVPFLLPRVAYRGILILGEAPGAEEEKVNAPFVGTSGRILARALFESGLVLQEPPAYPSPADMAYWWKNQGVILANVCPIRPANNDIEHFGSPDRPREEIIFGLAILDHLLRTFKPQLVIALGNWPLWAMTSRRGITKWRGSMLTGPHGEMVLPTYHPAAIARMWEWRPIMMQDLRRAAKYLPAGSWPDPGWDFLIRPSFPAAISFLTNILSQLDAGQSLRLAHDAETRRGHIACWGIATSPQQAICIPFMDLEHPEGYWSEEEEIALTDMIRRILQHPNAVNVGQNFAYDAQYTALWWACIPHLEHDTMVMQHVAFAGMPKSLDFLSSLYCAYHVYWKDEGKNWDPRTMPEDQLWSYNCRDAVATWEASVSLEETITKTGLSEVYQFQMKRLWPAVLRAMIRGVAIAKSLKGDLVLKLMAQETELAAELESLVPATGKIPWYQSPSQTRDLFYRDLGIRPIVHRKTGKPTVDDEALKTIAKREPLVRTLVDKLLLFRSLRVFTSTFLESETDPDGRMRCSYNIAGTETYRFSSSTNAFGRGMNLQNIPKSGVANVRRIFIPDPGYIICDSDLARADAQVVAWESNAPILKQIFRENLDLHTENAKLLGVSRQLAKTAVHLTNYAGSPTVLARTCGITIKEAEAFQRKYFDIHPEILQWHRRIEHEIVQRREVRNAFGYRRRYFGRTSLFDSQTRGILKEALAWIPQSTVACVINRGWANIEDQLPWVKVLMQVHDSLVYQIPKPLFHRREEIHKCLLIEVPYPDPLVIPVGLATSEVSWGDVKDSPWA